MLTLLGKFRRWRAKRKFRKLDAWLESYIKEDVPEYTACIASKGEGRLAAVLVGYDSDSLYVRRDDRSIQKFPKSELSFVTLTKEHRKTIYVRALDKLSVYGFSHHATYRVAPRENPTNLAPFIIHNSAASREANRLFKFRRSEEIPRLLTMFVDASTRNQFTAWFGRELEEV